MLKKPPAPPNARDLIRFILFGVLLVTAGCAAAPPERAETQAQPAGIPLYSGTITAIRPETSYPDPTGSLRQIMSILGQPSPPAVNASEFVIRMPADTIKTIVQLPGSALSIGAKVALLPGSPALIQPF
ncbi:hypothetical protein [Acidocella sp.]|uniref:hypothetical protein n=1 Tax=Acidocella sp. TaxID=50710 RepID=UPI002626FBCF|nr:hypothetical protein [Acidocella sp.]